jgi:putative component of membrane protein insertase Oxa1/YidC/SpoIIIJ protein YidD
MHSGQTADPCNKYAIELKKLTGQRKKEIETFLRIRRLEWEAGLYWDADLGPVWPSDNLERCIQEGAKQSKLGRQAKAGLLVTEDVVKLDYDGPRTMDKLWSDENFRLVKGVVINRQRVIRCRPRFPVGWSVTFSVEYDPEIIGRDKLVDAMKDAGALVGLSDWRPKYGRFEVEVVKG